jgi:hypothetical protein
MAQRFFPAVCQRMAGIITRTVSLRVPYATTRLLSSVAAAHPAASLAQIMQPARSNSGRSNDANTNGPVLFGAAAAGRVLISFHECMDLYPVSADKYGSVSVKAIEHLFYALSRGWTCVPQRIHQLCPKANHRFTQRRGISRGNQDPRQGVSGEFFEYIVRMKSSWSLNYIMVGSLFLLLSDSSWFPSMEGFSCFRGWWLLVHSCIWPWIRLPLLLEE